MNTTTLPRQIESQMKVRFPDCDPFNHLNNSKYIDYIINAREDQLLKYYNFDVYELAKKTCKDYLWVFDYRADKENQPTIKVNNQQIFECEEVVLKEIDLDKGIDHALIKLKTPVTDRHFAKIRDKGEIAIGDPLVLIGYPSGLPVKIAGDAQVLNLIENSFVTNVDAFSVNSGSGVFHAITGEVEGILSSGRQDYDGKGNCSSVKIYGMNEGNETVVKPTKVKEFLKSYKRSLSHH
jgi:hypothetical protein